MNADLILLAALALLFLLALVALIVAVVAWDLRDDAKTELEKRTEELEQAKRDLKHTSELLEDLLRKRAERASVAFDDLPASAQNAPTMQLPLLTPVRDEGMTITVGAGPAKLNGYDGQDAT